jgi:signal transduction histidine kinase
MRMSTNVPPLSGSDARREPAVGLKAIVRGLTALIVACALATAGSLVFITSYLHRLTTQIDANLQSVRAAEEIELQLLWHARNLNQASLMSAPALAAEASRAQVEVLRWLGTAHEYVSSDAEAAILAKLGDELDVYFAKQAQLATAGLPAMERYAEAAAAFDVPYEVAEQLLRVNVAQAAEATEQAATWDRIATGIGLTVAVVLLALTATLLHGAHRALYRPLLGLADAMRRYAARDPLARAKEEGPAEVKAIARAFNEMAEQLQRQRAHQLSFIATIAHELRNPLAAMKAGVQSIALRSTESASGPMTDLVSRQIDLLVRMLSDLLDSARIESGQLALAPGEHDVRDLLTDGIRLFEQVAPLHRFAVRVPEAELLLVCDRTRIMQVINNLLSNAIKYSPQGGRVEARALQRAGGVLIEVADEGIGIPEDEYALIFEPFRRSEGFGWAIPGVGIGLSVAKRIVEAHGGTISVQSLVGAGSTFRAWLPHRPPSVDGAPGE